MLKPTSTCILRNLFLTLTIANTPYLFFQLTESARDAKDRWNEESHEHSILFLLVTSQILHIALLPEPQSSSKSNHVTLASAISHCSTVPGEESILSSSITYLLPRDWMFLTPSAFYTNRGAPEHRVPVRAGDEPVSLVKWKSLWGLSWSSSGNFSVTEMLLECTKELSLWEQIQGRYNHSLSFI